ncbi:hypothetical protein Droror1_Dr00009927 [Drosera rotundifolia]
MNGRNFTPISEGNHSTQSPKLVPHDLLIHPSSSAGEISCSVSMIAQKLARFNKESRLPATAQIRAVSTNDAIIFCEFGYSFTPNGPRSTTLWTSFVFLDSTLEEVKVSRELKVPGNFEHPYVKSYECNGAICFSGEKNKLVLWNPTINECHIIPRCKIKGETRLIGSGLARKTNELKVVRITGDHGFGNYAIVPFSSTGVYTKH